MEFDFIIMVSGFSPILTMRAYREVKNKREALQGVEEDNGKWLRCRDIRGPRERGRAEKY